MLRARCLARLGSCLGSCSTSAWRELHAGGSRQSSQSAAAQTHQGRLPNRELIFALLEQLRHRLRDATTDVQPAKKRAASGLDGRSSEQLRAAAEAGDASAARLALSSIPQHLRGVAATLAVRLLLQRAGPTAANEFLATALDAGLLPAGSAGSATTLLLSHFAALMRSGDEVAAGELVAAATDFMQRGPLPHAAAALMLRATGRLGDGDLLRELWGMLQREKPTLGECNALLSAAAACGDAEAMELALTSMLEGHGRVNGIALVTLFQAARQREEARLHSSGQPC